MTEEPMSQAEYVKVSGGFHGSCCPFCRSTNISAGSVEINNGGASQEVWCDNCGNPWRDIYELTGYSNENY